MRALLYASVLVVLGACNATESGGTTTSVVAGGDRVAPTGSGFTKRLDRTDSAAFGPNEMRGTWMVASASRDGALRGDELVRLRGNTAFFQARSRGDAWYTSAIEPMAVAATADPLRACLEAAGDDYRVHAWTNMNLVANAVRVPVDPQHLVRQHPEWLCIPDALVGSKAVANPKSPEFLTELANFCAGRKNEFEGLYADPAVPEYRSYLANVIADIALRYPVAGIHFDYIRYANPASGLASSSLRAFESRMTSDLNATELSEMMAKKLRDPLIFVKRYPKAYLRFRQEAVSLLVKECALRIKSIRPSLTVSAAVFADVNDARTRRAQDWPMWLAEGYIDAAAPMNYTKDPKEFERRLLEAVSLQRSGRIWAGIGAWLLTPDETARRIEFARGAGAGGFILFSHHAVQSMSGFEETLKKGPLRLRSRP